MDKSVSDSLFQLGNFFFINEVMSGMSWWYPKSRVDLFTQEYSAFIKKALDEGVKFSIGSDAHCVHGVGNILWSHKILREIGATRDDIINVELY